MRRKGRYFGINKKWIIDTGESGGKWCLHKMNQVRLE